MNFGINYPIAAAAIFIWIGFVSAISFMEAWLKFKAPGVTLPLGLGIGKLVFNALNKVEWILFLIVILSLAFSKADILFLESTALFIPLIIIVLQSFWLLPKLYTRADIYINGESAAGSNIHFIYIAFEIVKAVSLFIYGINLFKYNS
jgi:hypothetical protein